MRLNSVCSLVGMLHGALAGAIVGLVVSQPPCASASCGGTAPLRAIPVAAAILFVLGLAVSLFILVCVERVLLASVFWPTVINAAIVISVVVTVVSRLSTSHLNMLLGWLIGTVLGWLIGALLCWLSCRSDRLAA